jgi:hypothetical protein
MKSSDEQLRSRGFLDEQDFLKFQKNPNVNLISLLNSKLAHERTAAIRQISLDLEDKYIPEICERLKIEKKLYTKLEISKCLEKYSEKAIPYLIPLIGKIGENQHKEIKIVDLNKSSFPLPRDIVARIMIRIGPKVVPYLKPLFRTSETMLISEIIDIIGHISWNFHDYSMEDFLIEYFKKNDFEEIITWKLIRAFQSFTSPEITILLEEIIANSQNEIFKKEAERSLNRISKRKDKDQ